MHIKNLHFDIPGDPRAGRSDAGRWDVGRWQRSIGAAISSVMDCCVEGFALHVASLHPEIFLSPRDNEGHDVEQPQFEQPQQGDKLS